MEETHLTPLSLHCRDSDEEPYGSRQLESEKSSSTDSLGHEGPCLPFVSSPMSVVHASLELAGIGADDVVLDLGCGDGRFCVAAAGLGARAIGYDSSPSCIREACRCAEKANVSSECSFEQVNIWARLTAGQPLIPPEVTMVFMFTSTSFARRIEKAVGMLLARGGRVVTYHYHFTELEPRVTARRGSLNLYQLSGKEPTNKTVALGDSEPPLHHDVLCLDSMD